MPTACCNAKSLPNIPTTLCDEVLAIKNNVTGCEEKIHDFLHDNMKTMEITFSVLIAVQVSPLFWLSTFSVFLGHWLRIAPLSGLIHHLDAAHCPRIAYVTSMRAYLYSSDDSALICCIFHLGYYIYACKRTECFCVWSVPNFLSLCVHFIVPRQSVTMLISRSI